MSVIFFQARFCSHSDGGADELFTAVPAGGRPRKHPETLESLF
jgi:hypothetical protein